MYINDFIFKCPIETGGFSTVWKVEYKKKEYALKMISKHERSTKIEKKMLKTEIKIHKELYHKNIIKMYNSFEDNFYVYILLELAEDDLFNIFLKNDYILSLNDVLKIAYQIIEGLIYLNSKNIVHGDIKMENILLVNNQYKICDFGLASSGFYHYNFVGTPEFMAPEIIKHHIYDTKVDIWSLGIIMYDLLYGHSPFTVYVNNIKYGTIDRKLTENAICNKELTFPEPDQENNQINTLLKRCLEKDPKKRISLNELLNHELFNNISK